MTALKTLKAKLTMPRNPSLSSPKRRTKAASEGIAPTVRVKEEPKAKVEERGRPTVYTEALAAEICKRVADGETLSQVCRSEHIPPRTTIMGWILDDREGFSVRYARAKDMQIEYWADELLDVSDDGTNDYMKRAGADDDENSGWVVNGEHIARSRLRVDSRKWLLSKLKPDRYGDKVMHAGHDGGQLQPIVYVTTTGGA